MNVNGVFVPGACFSCVPDFGTGGFAFGSGDGGDWHEGVDGARDDAKRRRGTTDTPNPSSWTK